MKTPLEQESIRDRCRHPSGTFVEFTPEEVEQSMPARFEHIARLLPDNLALATENHELTYTQLNRQANGVARFILQQPMAGAHPVALLFENDAPLVIAMVGALKTGHPCAVLDPSDPPARTKQTLAMLEPELIVTNRRNLSLACELQPESSRIVDIDNVSPELPDGNLNRAIAPTATALIIYTSGSTGQPKGVIVPHRTELQRTMTYANCLHICPTDRLALLASLTSAHGIMTTWRALLVGASIHLFDARTSGVHTLAQWLLQQRITFLQVGVPTFRHFVETLKGDESFPSVRILRLSSDQARSRDIESYRRHFGPECIFVHGLASTETGTATFYFLDKARSIADGPVPLGFPLDDIEILLWDDNGKEVGIGEVGTITVKNYYGSVGYWRNPELTKAKYLTDPASNEALFLTGDLGRWSDQGLVYCGRKDARVKIRGFSVDTKEIESVLLEHAAVKDAIVTGVEDPTGERRLVAYVVPRDSTATAVALRRFLNERLPVQLIPAAFVMMDALPLNSAGKVTRNDGHQGA